MDSKVHIFNVDHGDSAVIEFSQDGKTAYIVIDSNLVRRDNVLVNPAYQFLKSKNATSIDALILTHIHRDHYAGIEQFLDFDIGKVIIPPFLSFRSRLHNKILNQLKAKLERLADSPDEYIGLVTYSLARFIKFLSENENKIVQGTGPNQELTIRTFPNEPIGKILLPLPDIRGLLHNIIKNGDFELDSFKGQNEASVVVMLKNGEHKIVFGADSVPSQWEKHIKQNALDSVTSLESAALKVPHHGSKYENTDTVYTYILGNREEKTLLVSANGRSHPDDEFFALVTKGNHQPYCTNLAKQCLGSRVTSISGLSRLPREFRAFVSNYEMEDLPTPCQGDITVEIASGKIATTGSTGNQCIYRMSF